MILVKREKALRDHLAAQRNKGITIGFVPTMGALHAGHLSLLEAARAQNGLVVCSIFVNPTQFNDPKDFQKYPITLEADIEQLEKAQADVLFLPYVEEVYPHGTAQLPLYNLGFLETVFEGAFRPGHFQGVCQVMDRLLSIVEPDDLFMGQKDYQQCMVVSKLIALRSFKTTLHTCPTLREPDGLAMSSRNMRLDAEARRKAVSISEALRQLAGALQVGPVEPARAAAEQLLVSRGFKVDYIAVAAAGTLQPVTEWDGKEQLVLLAAAFLGEVRLIDNILVP